MSAGTKSRLRPFKSKPVIMLTGFTVSEKENLAGKIKKLSGDFLDSDKFSASCSHIVCKKPSKSEKFLSGCVLGKWIVMEDYILKSFANNRWLPEELFEWTDTRILPEGSQCSPELMKTPKRCRLARTRTGVGLFADWKVALLVENKKRHTVYKRLMEFGGATVSSLAVLVADPDEVKRRYTHIFVDVHHKSSIEGLASHEVLFLLPEYIGDYIVKDPPPAASTYQAVSSNSCPSDTNMPLTSGTNIPAHQSNDVNLKQAPSTVTEDSALLQIPVVPPETLPPTSVEPPPMHPAVPVDECPPAAAFQPKVKTAAQHGTKRKHSSNDEQPAPKLKKFSNKWKPNDSSKFKYLVPKTKKEDAITACELPPNFVCLYESCLEEDHGLTALDTLLSSVSSRFYPPPHTLHSVMVEVLLRSDDNLQAAKACQVLRTVLQLHPPFTPAIQDLYMQTFSLGGNGDPWTFIKYLISTPAKLIKDCPEYLADRLQSNLALLLEIVVDILECDFVHYASCYTSHDRPVKQNLISRIILPSSRVVTSQCRELLDFLGTKISDVEECPEQAESLQALLKLVAMVAECCQCVDAKDGSSSSKPVGEGEKALTFSRELMHKVAANCASDSVLLDNVLKTINPPWLRLKVCDLLLDSYDTSLLPQTCDRAEPVTLRKIVENYFYLLPPLDGAGHQKIKGTTSARVLPSVVTPRSSPLMVRKFNSSGSRPSPLTKVTLCSPSKPTIERIMKVNTKGENLLHQACIKNRPHQLKELLSVQGINVNAVDNAGWSPLHEACNHGHLECVQVLLNYKPKKTITSYFTVDKKTNMSLNLAIASPDGITPLHDAVINGHVEVAKLLIRAGGPQLLTLKTKEGYLPLECADTDEMREALNEPIDQLVVTPTKRRINKCLDFSLNESQLSQSSLQDDSGCFAFLPSEDVYARVLGSGDDRKHTNTQEGHKYAVIVYHLLVAYVCCCHGDDRDNSRVLTDQDKSVLKELCGHVRGFEMHLNRIMNRKNGLKPKFSHMKCLTYVLNE